MVMPNKLYDVLVWIVQIVLPAFGTLYAALSGIWGFPHCEEVVGTVLAIETFLGVTLKISNSQYKKNT